MKSYLNETDNLEYFLRVAQITKVYDMDSLDNSSASHGYGTIEILWMDGFGRVDRPIKATFPYISTLFGSGILYMPNVGDFVVCSQQKNGYPIVVGYFPNNMDLSAKYYTNRTTTNILNTLPMIPLRQGDVFIGSKNQAKILMDSDGSIKFKTFDQNSILRVKVGDTWESIVSPYNVKTDMLLGNSTNKDTISELPETYRNIPIYHRIRVVDTIAVEDESVTVSSGVASFANSPIETIQSVTNESGKTFYYLGEDFDILDNLTGIEWRLESKAPSKVVVNYTYLNEYYKLLVDNNGNLEINSTTIGINSAGNKSNYQFSLLVGKEGDIYINGTSLETYISEKIKMAVSEAILNVTGSLNINLVSATSHSDVSFTYTDNDDNTLVIDSSIMAVSSVSGIVLGESFNFVHGKDYKETSSGIQFIETVPDNNTAVTISYQTKAAGSSLTMTPTSINATIGNSNIALTSDTVSVSGDSVDIIDGTVNIKDGDVSINGGSMGIVLAPAQGSGPVDWSTLYVSSKMKGDI